MKYYYTDPLAAAWMAKHHDIKIESISSIPSIKNFMWRGVGDFIGIWEKDKYYIHPDSLRLLEPQSGDFIQFNIRGIKEARVLSFGDIASIDIINKYTIREHKEPERKKIIQRNGKAFMWPEVEP